jgi:hypothetical protein
MCWHDGQGCSFAEGPVNQLTLVRVHHSVEEHGTAGGYTATHTCSVPRWAAVSTGSTIYQLSNCGMVLLDRQWGSFWTDSDSWPWAGICMHGHLRMATQAVTLEWMKP